MINIELGNKKMPYTELPMFDKNVALPEKGLNTDKEESGEDKKALRPFLGILKRNKNIKIEVIPSENQSN